MTWYHKLIVWLLILLIPLLLWGTVSIILRRKLRVLYQRHFSDPRRERIFLSAVSFFLSFVTARAVAYSVHHEKISFRGIFYNGTHLHHLVFGILLLLLVGYLWLLQIGTGMETGTGKSARSKRWFSRITAVLYGISAALTLDEFALWLNLSDVYWAQKGRASIDAVIVFASVLSISLWGRHFFRTVILETAKTLRRLLSPTHSNTLDRKDPKDYCSTEGVK
jgi:hypothetical protein